MSTADFEILAEMDRADALIALADLQQAAALATAMDIIHRPSCVHDWKIKQGRGDVWNECTKCGMTTSAND